MNSKYFSGVALVCMILVNMVVSAPVGDDEIDYTGMITRFLDCGVKCAFFSLFTDNSNTVHDSSKHNNKKATINNPADDDDDDD